MHSNQKEENRRWKIIGSKPLLKSKWLNVEDRTYQLPDGKIAENFYHVSRPDYVLAFAIDDRERVVVERQYRRGVDDFVYELPAGSLNENESSFNAAVREIKEETGFETIPITGISVYPEPEFMSLKAHIVILKIVKTFKNEKKLDPFESYQLYNVEMKSLGEIRQMEKQGKIQDMGFLAALSIYSSYKQEKNNH